MASPEEQLEEFLAKYDPAVAQEVREAHGKMRARLPGAVEMVYDNYNALVIGFSPDEKPSHAVFSLAAFPGWVTLCFLQGAGLPDPDGLLQGSGNVVRNVRLQPLERLDSPPVRALMDAALASAPVPFDETQPSRLLIKSISAKQRPRRRP
ncbi:MAG TPA: DUF1801 domain-containing protein [Longimicrobiaceae bacterium]|jgi:hypothetical protein|nr:DUF1801 domain-containing protein [Longimicrobiaceae bacterium]